MSVWNRRVADEPFGTLMSRYKMGVATSLRRRQERVRLWRSLRIARWSRFGEVTRKLTMMERTSVDKLFRLIVRVWGREYSVWPASPPASSTAADVM